MRMVAIACLLGLASCAHAPEGVDSAVWRKDFRACQAQASQDWKDSGLKAKTAWEENKANVVLLGVGSFVRPKEDAAWVNQRTDECLMAKGYPSSPALR